MPSLVMLMIECENPEGISARKLVVETAKHNVITAYNMDDGLDLLRRFPNVDAVFVHGSIVEESPDILAVIRQVDPGVPLILGAPFDNMRSPHPTFIIDSHDPQEILRLLHGEIQPRHFR